MGQYSDKNYPCNLKKLNRIEAKIYSKKVQNPKIDFYISIPLFLTNINGQYITSKNSIFHIEEINTIITLLEQKRGSFYLSDDIWKSICNVERGKVTNKLRFMIYKRDNYRCKMCGKQTNDLEIDHIIPIAKGGKTTFNNLQTLCHSCNVKKDAR